MTYVLGIDLGTSSLKGLLMDESGKVINNAIAEYELIYEETGYSEQNPSSWILAIESVLKILTFKVPDMVEKLKGISFSGQMHSLVLLDKNNKILRNAILWNDVRTRQQCEVINEKLGKKLIEITGNIALEGFTLPKILWVQENEPEIWDKVAHLMLPKDYLALWFTGKYSTDYSDAAGTLLLDIRNKKWSKDILDAFNIPVDILPELYESSQCVGQVSSDIKEKFGFMNSIAVFAGGADNACAALGSGLTTGNIGMVSIGTSGVFLSTEKSSELDYKGKLHLFNSAVPGGYYSMGVTLSAGNSLNWFKNTFVSEMNFEDFLSEVGTVEPGSDGLVFTPYIVGERTPYADSKIRGSFIGLDIHHQKKHFIRAVLEGIIFSLKDTQIIMRNAKEEQLEYLVSVGGGAKSPEWLQIQADIFGLPIRTLETEQGPGVGAAMLAAMGIELFNDFTSCVEAFVSYNQVYKPNKINQEKYQRAYQIYREVYPATKEISHQLLATRE